MRRCTDPLALDPFSPIAHISSTTDPLALEPLYPLSAGARPMSIADDIRPPLTGHPTPVEHRLRS
jgi:hypothetical protein